MAHASARGGVEANYKETTRRTQQGPRWQGNTSMPAAKARARSCLATDERLWLVTLMLSRRAQKRSVVTVPEPHVPLWPEMNLDVGRRPGTCRRNVTPIASTNHTRSISGIRRLHLWDTPPLLPGRRCLSRSTAVSECTTHEGDKCRGSGDTWPRRRREGSGRPARSCASGATTRERPVCRASPRLLSPRPDREDSAHIAELQNAKPKQPFFFLKPPSSMLLPGEGPCLRPKGVDMHFEVELALVMGRVVRDLRAEDEQGAMDAIEGQSLLSSFVVFTLAHDPSLKPLWCASLRRGH